MVGRSSILGFRKFWLLTLDREQVSFRGPVIYETDPQQQNDQHVPWREEGRGVMGAVAAGQSRMKTYPLYLNGAWVVSDNNFPVVNPATGEVFARMSAGDAAQAARAIQDAQAAFAG